MSGRRSDAPGTPATRALEAAGIAFTGRSYDHDPRVTTFGLEAAEKLGVEADRVFKTLLAFVDGSVVVAIVPVTGSLDIKALALAAGGSRATMADAALAERRTGYVVGGISPIGQRTASPTWIDETAAVYDTVLVSGGRRGFDVELAPDDLLSITGGRYAAIAR